MFDGAIAGCRSSTRSLMAVEDLFRRFSGSMLYDRWNSWQTIRINRMTAGCPSAKQSAAGGFSLPVTNVYRVRSR